MAKNKIKRILLDTPLQARFNMPGTNTEHVNGTMRAKWRVWQEKLLLVKRLQRQKPSSRSRVMYEEQVKLGWPGLAEETRNICAEIGL